MLSPERQSDRMSKLQTTAFTGVAQDALQL